ncbi:MAG: M56 family metallopeptidase [Eubacteriales bacterium]|nr:M56 family metallopeptidase [Eubacteriales bacterium]
MNLFLNQLAHTSIMMTVIAGFYILAGVWMRKNYFAEDFYDVGKIILFGFLIPFRPRVTVMSLKGFSGPKSTVNLQKTITAMYTEHFESDGRAVLPTVTGSTVNIIFLIWLLGFLVVLFYQLIKYVRFKSMLRRWSEDFSEVQIVKIFQEMKKEFGINSELRLKKCACISGPMLIQLSDPVILLTDHPVTGEDLKLILRHEMIHLKRKDLWFRWALLLAAAVNWFNPVIYIFSGVFNDFCELSCDEKVTENMSESGKYRYSMILIHLAGRYSKQGTLFSAFSRGGKGYMKKRLYSIMNTTKKKFGPAVLMICILSVLCAGTAFAASPNWKTDEEIQKEMEEAFSEVFSNEFNEDDFPGMIITYDEKGIPIVLDPNPPAMKEGVYATGRYEKNGFYSSSDCASSNLVFYILKGQQVEVLDSSYTTAAAKVKYAGATGYMKKTKVKF